MTIAMDDRITVQGSPGSPYTRKMLAVLRYRQISYRFLHWGRSEELGWPQPKVSLLPTFYFPDDDGNPQPVTDSSPLIRRLETSYPERGIIPSDPVLAMINLLLEDYGDEWLTKPMFHFRWQYEADTKRSADVLPHWRAPAQSDEVIWERGKQFADRQIGRLGVVGSNNVTGPVIEDSYRRFVTLLNAHLSKHRFLMGARPGSSDFAVYGQLTCLAQFDPTPMAITLATGGRIYAWVSVVEDLSGSDPQTADWFDSNKIPGTLSAMLQEMGRTYVPVMLANELAVNRGDEQVQATVDGKPWQQKPFPYQAKCLRWLREAAHELSESDRSHFETIISGTGLEKLFEPV